MWVVSGIGGSCWGIFRHFVRRVLSCPFVHFYGLFCSQLAGLLVEGRRVGLYPSEWSVNGQWPVGRGQ